MGRSKIRNEVNRAWQSLSQNASYQTIRKNRLRQRSGNQSFRPGRRGVSTRGAAMNIPHSITLKWLRQPSGESAEIHGNKITLNAHLLVVHRKINMIRCHVALRHSFSIKGKATVNTLQLMCVISSRPEFYKVPNKVWSAKFLTSQIPKTGRTPL